MEKLEIVDRWTYPCAAGARRSRRKAQGTQHDFLPQLELDRANRVYQFLGSWITAKIIAQAAKQSSDAVVCN
jgi:hypothetical protein